MPAFILAIFLSAFLLFQVQPIIARYILPWYGGSPAVWTTCMLFFQVGLLLGYTYAHLLVSRFRDRPRWQAGIHLGLLALSLSAPPDHALRKASSPPARETSPVGGIVLLLLLTVGLPYIVISASGPLLQHWFGSVAEGKSPYRLYAISNFGSLLGLLTYPILFEPNLRLGQQTAYCGRPDMAPTPSSPASAPGSLSNVSSPPHRQDPRGFPPTRSPPEPPSPTASSGSPSPPAARVLLLATTNQMCQDVAVVPFLWILPLSLYLVTFIIAFDHARWYFRPFWIPLAAVSIAALVYLLNQEFADTEMHLTIQIAIYSTAMFAGCMVCHGEMVRLKPDPRYLTSFYLAVSLGGALGGVFVGLVAPRIFTGYWELHTGLVAFAVLAGILPVSRSPATGQRGRTPLAVGRDSLGRRHRRHGILPQSTRRRGPGRTRSERPAASTASCASTRRNRMTEDHYRALYHGRISHGRQFMDDQFPLLAIPPTTPKRSGPGVLFSIPPEPRRSRAIPLP